MSDFKAIWVYRCTNDDNEVDIREFSEPLAQFELADKLNLEDYPYVNKYKDVRLGDEPLEERYYGGGTYAYYSQKTDQWYSSLGQKLRDPKEWERSAEREYEGYDF